MNDIPRSNSFSNQENRDDERKNTNFHHANIDYRFIMLSKDEGGLEDGTVVHCQQMVEKLMKHIIQNVFGKVEKTHELIDLADLLLELKIDLYEYEALLRRLTDYYYKRRYSSANLEEVYRPITRRIYKYTLDKSFEVREILIKYCKDKKIDY